MELDKEKIDQLKTQIIQHIENNFPPEKKGYAIEKIKSMEGEEFLDFLKKNNLAVNEESGEDSESGNGNSPFRMIIEGKIHSYLVEENDNSKAVLEIRPISKGHVIIIPKKPIVESGEIPKEIFDLAKKISKKIKTKFKPREVSISSSLILGEMIVNVLPVYSEETLNSPRKQASKEELEEVSKLLGKNNSEKKERKQPKPKKMEEGKIIIPRRIP